MQLPVAQLAAGQAVAEHRHGFARRGQVDLHRHIGKIEYRQHRLALKAAGEGQYRFSRLNKTNITPAQRGLRLTLVHEGAKTVQHRMRVAFLPDHGQHAVFGRHG